MKPTTILGVKRSNYAGINNLLNLVFASLTGNADFTTPLPALTVLQTDATQLAAAIAAWGPVGNRGSHAQLLDLRAKALTAYNDLLAEAAYVQNTAQVMAVMIMQQWPQSLEHQDLVLKIHRFLRES